MLKRRTVLTHSAALAASVPLALSTPALGQGRKDTVVLAMALEPPGLDPTANAASAIAEITLYNIYETLTKINSDGSVSPLLAESWESRPTCAPTRSGCARASSSTTASRSTRAR